MGIQIFQYLLPGPADLAGDFGGQDIYHGTRALFTDARAFYIIVWTRQNRPDPDSKQQPLQYWLDYVSAMGRDGDQMLRVILAESECEGKSDFDGAWPGLMIPSNIDPLVIGYDLKPGGNQKPEVTGAALILLLQQELKKHASRMRMTVGQNWADLRDFLLMKARRFKPDSTGKTGPAQDRMVSATTFATWCGKCGIEGDQAVDAVRTYLHEAGAIFHKPSLFGGQVVVDQ